MGTFVAALLMTRNLYICKNLCEIGRGCGTSGPETRLRSNKLHSQEENRMNTLPSPDAPNTDDAQAVKLTKREVEVLTLVIEGKSSKEVAEQLFVSKRTVDFHLANIYSKLSVSNRVQAFREATRRGLIPFHIIDIIDTKQ